MPAKSGRIVLFRVALQPKRMLLQILELSEQQQFKPQLLLTDTGACQMCHMGAAAGGQAASLPGALEATQL